MTMLKCEDIKKYFKGKSGVIKAVDGVSLNIDKGDVFGLVGESGCGKTTLGKVILGILKPDSGNIILNSDKMQVIFQDPCNSLDPRMRVFDILAEGLLIRRSSFPPSHSIIRRGGLNLPYGHQVLRRTGVIRDSYDIKRRVEDVLDLIKLPKDALGKYPHQFSGGEKQRIAIGRAVITNPEFIVCDEPVSNLDVTIQLQILNLLKDIQKKFNMTYLFISHDLKVVKFMCGSIAVMREGRIIESQPAKDLFLGPQDPYTKALLSSAFYDTMKS